MKRVLKAVGVLAVVAVIGAGVMAYRMYARMKGPTPPSCAAPALARKAFEPPLQLSSAQSPGALVYDIEPSAAVAPDGALSVVYNPRDWIWKGRSGLSTARVALDGKVSARAYPTDRQEAFDAWMTACPDGKLRMVWLAHDGGRPEKAMKIGYAQSDDGLSWSAPPGEAHAPADCKDGARGCLDKPMIACAKDRVVVLYYSGLVDALRATTSPYARAKFEVSAEAGRGAYADVAVSAPSGRVHLVFMASEEGLTEEEEAADSPFGAAHGAVWYARSDDQGQTFSKALRVSAAGEPVPFFFSNPQVAVDETRGFLYVAYPTGTPDGRWDVRLATSRDEGRSWTSVQVNDDPRCATHMTPHTALDPLTGTLHVTWLENRSGKGALAYAACEVGGHKCGPNEAVSGASFASFGFERHLPAWLSEYGALVLDAERRLLHAVWTQPVDEDGRATSRIFYARAKL